MQCTVNALHHRGVFQPAGIIQLTYQSQLNDMIFGSSEHEVASM